MSRSWTKNPDSDRAAYFEHRVRGRRHDSEIDAPPVPHGFVLTNVDAVLEAQERAAEAEDVHFHL